MSIGDNLKGKNLIVVAAALVVLFIVVVVVFFPAPKDNTAGPEVISKRVKINIQEDTAPMAEGTNTEAAPSKEPEKTAVTEPAPKKTEQSAGSPIKIDIAGETPAKAEKAPEKKETVKKAEKAPEKAVAPKKAKKETTVASKAPSKGEWALNVASFTNLRDARTLRSKLKTSGYNSYITEFTKDSTRWYRVRVGFYPTRADAVTVGKKLKHMLRGQTPWVVKPPKEEVSAYAG